MKRNAALGQTRKRQRQVHEFLSSESDDSDSGDEFLLRANKTTMNRDIMSVAKTEMRKPSSATLFHDDDNNDDANSASSASTNELVRRVKGESTPSSKQKRQPEKKQIRLDDEMKMSAKEAQTASDVTRHETSTKLTASASLRNETPLSEDDFDDGLSLKDNDADDESSVSTMELARRIRGEVPATQSKDVSTGTFDAVDEVPETLASEKGKGQAGADAKLPTETEITADPEDLYLPSPLPSDQSSSEQDEDEYDDVLEVLPPKTNGDDIFHETMPVVEAHTSRKTARDENFGNGIENNEAQESLHRQQPIVREGLRKSMGPFARQRLLNATSTIEHNNNNGRRGSTLRETPTSSERAQNEEYAEEIGDFSDEEIEFIPRVPVRRASRGAGSRSERNIRNVSDPSFAANVVGNYQRPASNPAASRSTFDATTIGSFVERNDLSGGSGVGAGQYQMIAEPPPPAQRPAARGGRGGRRNYGARGGGGGRGRRRGKSKGRGRGRGRRGASSRATNYAPNNNAWSDYAAQSASWASSSQPSNLGNVGGAEVSF